MWVFIVGPAFIGFIFEPTNMSYKEYVIASIGIAVLLLGIAAITLVLGLCINFIGGDSEPITTMMNRFK